MASATPYRWGTEAVIRRLAQELSTGGRRPAGPRCADRHTRDSGRLDSPPFQYRVQRRGHLSERWQRGAGTPSARNAACRLCGELLGRAIDLPTIAAPSPGSAGCGPCAPFSAVFMLAATGFVFGFGRRQFNWTVGIVAAATFSVAASTLFLGNLATYDAMAVGLLSFALWLLPVAIGATGWRSWGAVAGSGMVAALAGRDEVCRLLYLRRADRSGLSHGRGQMERCVRPLGSLYRWFSGRSVCSAQLSGWHRAFSKGFTARRRLALLGLRRSRPSSPKPPSTSAAC